MAYRLHCIYLVTARSTMPLLERVGPYTLIRLLWSGRDTDVFLARACKSAGVVQTVAIKCLRPQIAMSGKVLRAFLHEMRLAARVNHPNVVHVFDAGQSSGITYATMEYLPGWRLPDLTAKLAAERMTFPAEAALGIVAQLADGVEHVHTLEVVGRDGGGGMVLRNIAPDNIVVNDDGQTVLLDFGSIAASAGRGEHDDVCDSPFAAPEVLAGRGFGPTSDVFSLGKVLGELCHTYSVTDDVADIIETSTQPNPSRRFQTCRELRKAIDNAARNMSLAIDCRSVAQSLNRAIAASEYRVEALA